LKKAFFIAPFDAKAAKIAVELQHDRELINSIRAEFGLSRPVIASDIAIIATSVAFGASRLIAEDGHMVKLAQGKMIIQGLDQTMFEKEA
jgi:hypothetical protein